MKNKFSLFASILLLAGLMLGCSPKEQASVEPTPPPQNDQNVVTKEEVEHIFVYGDIVAGAGCVLQNRFQKGEKVIFRANALDPLTQEQIEGAELTLHLENGDSYPMQLGEHGESQHWVAAFEIPEEMPTGTLEYHVSAEFAGKKGTFTPFNQVPTSFTIYEPEPEETES